MPWVTERRDAILSFPCPLIREISGSDEAIVFLWIAPLLAAEAFTVSFGDFRTPKEGFVASAWHGDRTPLGNSENGEIDMGRAKARKKLGKVEVSSPKRIPNCFTIRPLLEKIQ